MNKFQLILLFGIFSSLFFTIKYSNAQKNSNSDKQVVLKVGSGVNFGGVGVCSEFRKDKFGVQVFYGYKKSESGTNYYIPSSHNFGLNSFYYFLDQKSPIKPKVGLHFGWLNNYYNLNIGTKDYNPSVYGLAFVPGLEFGDDFILFGLNLIIDPGIAIIDNIHHPYYGDNKYFSLSAGVGIDVIGLNRAMKNFRILKNYEKNQKRRKPDGDNDEDDNYFTEKNSIEDKCAELSSISEGISKGICGENVVYQQINSNKFVIIEFERNISDYNGTNNFNVKEDRYAHVYVITGAEFNDFCSILEISKKHTKATDGTISLYVSNNPSIEDTYKISLILKGISISTQIENEIKEQIFDEIVICDLTL